VTAKYWGDAFRFRFGPWAVVAGGSDGIGEAFARELARRGLSVALIARRREPLESLAADLRAQHGVEARAITCDLTSAAVAETVAAATRDLDVGLFVYNAGSNRTPRRFLDSSIEDALFLEQLSCRGPLLLAHHFGTRLRARGRGGIVLMSSLQALAGAHYQATYAATKAFDTVLAEGLWHELAPEGVDVLGVLAGATRTPTGLAVSEKFRVAMDPAEVAVGALDHLGKGPSYVPGDKNRAVAKSLWPVPRVGIINAMSQAVAELFDLPHAAIEGKEFHEP
jgi:short-subunit dehydrogenase